MVSTTRQQLLVPTIVGWLQAGGITAGGSATAPVSTTTAAESETEVVMVALRKQVEASAAVLRFLDDEACVLLVVGIEPGVGRAFMWSCYAVLTFPISLRSCTVSDHTPSLYLRSCAYAFCMCIVMYLRSCTRRPPGYSPPTIWKRSYKVHRLPPPPPPLRPHSFSPNPPMS